MLCMCICMYYNDHICPRKAVGVALNHLSTWLERRPRARLRHRVSVSTSSICPGTLVKRKIRDTMLGEKWICVKIWISRKKEWLKQQKIDHSTNKFLALRTRIGLYLPQNRVVEAATLQNIGLAK